MKKYLLLLIAVVSIQAIADTVLPVLVVSGMKTESAISQGPGVITVLSAGDATLLRSRLQPYNATNVRAVLSFGIAGGLDPSYQPGQLVIADTVTDVTNTWTVTPALAAFLKSRFTTAGIPLAGGLAAGQDTNTAIDPASKAALYQATGASIVDNESQVVADFATANNLPFAVIRTVDDPASLALPPAALIPLLPDGTPNESAIMDSVLKDPSQISVLNQLNDDSNAGLSTLKKCTAALPLGSLPESNGNLGM